MDAATATATATSAGTGAVVAGTGKGSSSSSEQALTHLYDVHNGDFLGSGAYCTGVFRCSQKATGRAFAVKVVSTLDSEQHQHAQQEIRILRELCGVSPHFVHLEDVFHTDSSVCLVMELLHCGNLQQYVAVKGKVTEGLVLETMHQLLFALVQLHTRLNVVHRDIKPDNIGVASESPLRLVLLDFGHAKYFGKDDMSTASHPPLHALHAHGHHQQYYHGHMHGHMHGHGTTTTTVNATSANVTASAMLLDEAADFLEPLHRQISLSSPVDSTPCGSVPYLAPEVIGHLASEEAREPRQTTRLLVQKLDVFSVGVVGAYLFSAGFWLPFVVSGEQRVTMDEMHSRMSMGGEIRFPPRYFGKATPAALGFLRSLLVSDPNQRPTALEALRHPWFPHHTIAIPPQQAPPPSSPSLAHAAEAEAAAVATALA